MDEIPLHSLLVAFVVLLLISAFFSISETSMMALNRYRLKHLAKTGNRGARLTAKLLAQIDKLLGVVLLGSNRSTPESHRSAPSLHSACWESARWGWPSPPGR